MFTSACREEKPKLPVFQMEIPFRQDGNLQFVLPDGSTAARIAIEIAATDSAQARGLMQRRSLPPDTGMLFVMDKEEQRAFWMANTPMPLDIIFVNADSVVVKVADHTTPYSQQNIESDLPAQYVVEVRAGYAARHGIVPGSRIAWETTANSASR